MALKKILAVVAASSLALGLAACSTDDSGDSGNYILANGSEPQNALIPGNTNETGGGRIIDLLYSGLVYYDKDGKTHNEVAESIESDDNKLFTVKLKNDWTFSDGQPVTANSFVDAWNYTVENSLLSAYFFEPIAGYEEGAASMEGLKVIDDHTFTIELAQPEADFPLRLGYSAFYPLPEEAFDDIEAFGEKPNGNGPYTLENWDHNVSATLIPSQNYNGERKAHNDGIQFSFYASQDAAYTDLIAGNLDVLDAVPDSAFGVFEDELGDRAENEPSAVFQSFTIPENLEHFHGEEGKLRRQALSLAIDRDEVTETIFHGTRTPAKDFSSTVMPGYSDNIPGNQVLTFDPEKAKELWEKAEEISPFEGKFGIAYNSDGGHQSWVDAVANSIKNNLGIEAVGVPYPDFKSLRDEVTNRTIKTAFRTGWQPDYPSVGNYLGPLYATDAGSNDGDYSNPEFDAKLKEAAAAGDSEEATTLYNEAQEILFEDLPAIPLWYSNITGGHSEAVSNVDYAWNSTPVYYNISKS